MSLRPFALTAAVPFLVAVATVGMQRPGGPVLYADEMAYLGIAAELSTRDAAPSLAELEFYSPGYGALLAPVLSIVDVDPWVIGVGANLLFIALLGPALLVLLTEVLHARGGVAVVAAIAGACAPSTMMQVPRSWPECLLALLYVLWAIALHRVLAHRSAQAGPILAAIGVLAFVVHRRGVVLLLATAAVLVVHHGVAALRDVRSRDPRSLARLGPAGLAAAVGVGGFLAARAADDWVQGRLYRGADLVNATERAGELLGQDLGPRLVAAVWSLSHATLGVAVVGVLGLASMVRKGPQRPWAATILGVLAGAVALSVLVIADGPRVDHLLYERYVAPVATIVVAIGVAGLGAVAQVRTRAVTAVAVLGGTTLAMLALNDLSGFRGDVQKLTVPVLSTLTLVVGGAGDAFVDGISPVAVAAVVAAVLVVALAIARRSPTVGGAALVGVFALTSIAGSAWSLRPNLDVWEGYARPLSDAIERADGGVGPIGLAEGAPDPLGIVVQYRLDYPELVAVGEGTCPDVRAILAAPGFDPSYPVEVLGASAFPPAVALAPRCG